MAQAVDLISGASGSLVTVNATGDGFTTTPITGGSILTVNAAGVVTSTPLTSSSVLSVNSTGTLTSTAVSSSSIIAIGADGAITGITGASGQILAFGSGGALTVAAAPTATEDIVSFCAGAVNWTMPTTWPFIIDGLDLSSIGAALQPLADLLQAILNLPSAILTPATAVLDTLLGAVQGILNGTHLAYVSDFTTLANMILQFYGQANQPNPVLKMNSFVGLANVGTAIQLGDTSLNIWGGMVAGPPYPITMPRAGKITKFEADFDVLAVLNPMEIINIIPGLSTLLDVAGTLVDTILGLGTIVLLPLQTALGALGGLLNLPTFVNPLPSLNTTISPSTIIDMGATIWKVPSIMLDATGQINMAPNDPPAFIAAPLELTADHNQVNTVAEPIARINLGPIELAHIAAWDSTTSLPGTGMTAIASVLGLNGAASNINTAESGHFGSSLVDLPVPIDVAQGESLMVQFSILSVNGFSGGVAVAAPNVSANITFA